MEMLLAIPAIMAGYTYVETQKIERNHPPQGQFLTVAGKKVHYVEKGIGQTVVLMHGANSTLADFTMSPTFEALAESFRVIAIDRPGYGYSERFVGADSPAEQARHIHAFLKEKGVEQPIMVGYSWSGALVTSYALQFPSDIGGLIVINGATHPWPTPDDWKDVMGSTPILGDAAAWTVTMPLGKALIGPGVERVFSPQPVPVWYKRIPMELILRPGQFRANSEDLIGLKPFLKRQQAEYENITTPTVIVVGEGDVVVSPRIHAQPLHKAIKGSRFIRVPGAGHPMHHTHPDVIVQAVKDLAYYEKSE